MERPEAPRILRAHSFMVGLRLDQNLEYLEERRDLARLQSGQRVAHGASPRIAKGGQELNRVLGWGELDGTPILGIISAGC